MDTEHKNIALCDKLIVVRLPIKILSSYFDITDSRLPKCNSSTFLLFFRGIVLLQHKEVKLHW